MNNETSTMKSKKNHYDKYFNPKRSESVNRFNPRIDPLVKIETHVPYKQNKSRLFYDYYNIDEQSYLNNNYPHRFNSPSHSSFSRQTRIFSSQNIKVDSSLQSTFLKRKQNLSALQGSKHLKNSMPLSNNSKIVYLSFRKSTPDRPFKRYSQLSVSKLD